MRTTSTRLIALVALLLFAACGGSNPVPESVIFSGTVTYLGTSWHSLPLTESGIVEIDVLTLEPALIDITDVIQLNLFLGLGIGQPAGDNCSPTTRTTVREGDSVVYGLGVKEYCISLFDTGALPEDAVIRYTLEVSSS